MIDTTGLKNLQIDCVVWGVSVRWEQQQRIVMDIELAHDIIGAASTDEASKAVDYDRVAEAVTDLRRDDQSGRLTRIAEACAKM